MAAPRKSPRAATSKSSAAVPAPALVQAPVDAPAGAPEASPALALGAVIEQVEGFTQVVRQASASSLEQSRAAFDRLKEAADEAAAITT